MAGAGDELRRAGKHCPKSLERRTAHGDRVLTPARLKADRLDHFVEPLGGESTRVDRDRHPLGNDIRRPRLDLERTDGREHPVTRILAHAKNELRGLDEGVCPVLDRCRPCMSRAALEGDRAARLTADSGHDPEWLAETLEHRPLLDMNFDEGLGQFAEPAAPHWPRFLRPEGDHGEVCLRQP